MIYIYIYTYKWMCILFDKECTTIWLWIQDSLLSSSQVLGIKLFAIFSNKALTTFKEITQIT